MRRTIDASRELSADADGVWAVLADFAHVDRFNPTIAVSRSIEGHPAQGLGARRHCDFNVPGLWVQETVVVHDDDARHLVARIDAGPGKPPLGDVLLDFRVTPLGDERCRVDMAIVADGNRLQWLVARGLRRSLERTATGVLAGLEEHVRTGRVVATRRDLVAGAGPEDRGATGP